MTSPQPRSQVPAGTVLAEKFRITREIGRGGMAAVFEAENVHIGKRVAVKILNAELVTSRVVRERFLREARAAAATISPYICDVYDSGMYDGRPFLVMELLEGESLYDMMTRVRRLDPELTLRIATHTCRGLAKAHEANVIHRDLKPENIFLTKNEEGETVAKVLDFGLAKFYEPVEADAAQVRLTREGALFGTPAYMSPEQAKGKGDVDHRADLWALGCIVYECLTGQTVWNVDQGVAMILAQIASAPIPKPRKLRPDLPETFDAWFAKALERDPNKRFQTSKEFADALADALSPGSGRSFQTSSMPSEEEGALVDALVSHSHAVIQAPSSGPQPQSSSPQQVFDLPQGGLSTMPPPRRNPAKAVVALLGVATLALAGYAVWFYVINPAQSRGVAPVGSAPLADVDGGAADAGRSVKLEPQETEPYALQIGSAQKWLNEGRVENALSMFKEAFNNGGTGVSRSLLNHATVALPKSDGPCRLTGLARPRPFDVVVPSSRPTVALSSGGPLMVWVDTHQDNTRRQAFSVLLDPSLQRVTPARVVTPESESVRHPQLLPAGDKLAFVYWDGAGKEPGVYVRLLEPDGRIASPARRISGIQRHEFYPALTQASDGTFWAVWEEALGDGTDLVARHLSATVEPLGEAVRLSEFAPARVGKTEASKPDVAIDDGHMYIVFSLERNKKRQIMMLRIALSDDGLKNGIGEDKKKRRKRDDRVVGTLTPVSKSHGKNSQPRVACGSDGCFVAWDDESAGALAAFIDRKQGQALWHREFARKGARPALGSGGQGVAVAWYEGARVKLAKITRDGVDTGTALARVGGYQPYPAIVAGSEPGQWYISWRDYESGHLEAFLVRAQCQ